MKDSDLVQGKVEDVLAVECVDRLIEDVWGHCKEGADTPLSVLFAVMSLLPLVALQPERMQVAIPGLLPYIS